MANILFVFDAGTCYSSSTYNAACTAVLRLSFPAEYPRYVHTYVVVHTAVGVFVSYDRLGMYEHALFLCQLAIYQVAGIHQRQEGQPRQLATRHSINTTSTAVSIQYEDVVLMLVPGTW